MKNALKPKSKTPWIKPLVGRGYQRELARKLVERESSMPAYAAGGSFDISNVIYAPSNDADCDFGIRCPVCGQENSHVREAYTRMGTDEGVTYRGTEVKEQSSWRRSALVICFDGECEHRWRFVIQQHKGTDFFSIERGPNQAQDLGLLTDADLK